MNASETLASPALWASPELPFLPFGEGAAKIALYMDMLLAWNRKLNLSGATDAVSLMRDLVQDSFFVVRFLEDLFGQATPVVWDLGAGAGLPGLPLRLFWQRGQYTLVERREKRALFLENARSRLNLPDTPVYHGDARNFFAKQDRPADCILSRAFMPWPDLGAFCMGNIAREGILLVMANEPPPTLEPDLRLRAQMAYRLPGRRRWLWAIGHDA